MTDAIIGMTIVALIFMAIYSYKMNKQEKREKKFDDRNIEWYGPDISYKRKNYPDLELNEDHRTGTIDKDKLA